MVPTQMADTLSWLGTELRFLRSMLFRYLANAITTFRVPLVLQAARSRTKHWAVMILNVTKRAGTTDHDLTLRF